MSDSMKDKINKTGEAVKNAAVAAGKRVQEGASKVAEKAGDAATATGNAVKKAGEAIKKKGGG